MFWIGRFVIGGRRGRRGGRDRPSKRDDVGAARRFAGAALVRSVWAACHGANLRERPQAGAVLQNEEVEVEL
jgi:hypothetical protein